MFWFGKGYRVFRVRLVGTAGGTAVRDGTANGLGGIFVRTDFGQWLSCFVRRVLRGRGLGVVGRGAYRVYTSTVSCNFRFFKYFACEGTGEQPLWGESVQIGPDQSESDVQIGPDRSISIVSTISDASRSVRQCIESIFADVSICERQCIESVFADVTRSMRNDIRSA